jgi:hypothetical protein
MKQGSPSTTGRIPTGIAGLDHILCGGLPANRTYLADTVLALRFFELNGAVHKAISVIKKRTGKHESTIRELKIDRSGIFVSPPLDKFRGVLTGVPIAAEILETRPKTKNASR